MFLAIVRETGNARAAARMLGFPHMFNNRMKSHPGFRRDCAAAAVQADWRLRDATSPFLAPIEHKSADPPGGDRPGMPKGEAKIRRTRGGRAQISHVREGDWNSKDEAAFLTRLRETGNFDASARAIGFNPRTAYKHAKQWPAFARDCEEAIEEASVKLDYRLIAHAHALLRDPQEPLAEGEAEVPFDPEAAMRILSFIDRRRAGLTGRGRRKIPPERSFEEAKKSILAKIEAIERHEAWRKEREAKEAKPAEGGQPPDGPEDKEADR